MAGQRGQVDASASNPSSSSSSEHARGRDLSCSPNRGGQPLYRYSGQRNQHRVFGAEEEVSSDRRERRVRENEAKTGALDHALDATWQI